MKAAGDRYIRIVWTDDTRVKELLHIKQNVMSLEAPDDLLVHIEDYEFGDPDTNGKGHQRCPHPITGRPAVKMPESNIWRVKRKQEIVAQQRVTIVGAGDDVPTERVFEQMFNDLSAQVTGTRSVGQPLMSLSSLLGGGRSSSSNQAASPPSHADTASLDNTAFGGGGFWGCGMDAMQGNSPNKRLRAIDANPTVLSTLPSTTPPKAGSQKPPAGKEGRGRKKEDRILKAKRIEDHTDTYYEKIAKQL